MPYAMADAAYADHYATHYGKELANRFTSLMYKELELATLEQVEKDIGDLAHQITSLQSFLATMIAKHGNDILRSWRKMSQVARQRILEHVCPKMFPYCWLPAHAYAHSKQLDEFSKSIQEHSVEASLPMVFLSPWLDMPSLKTEPDKLLALIHYRSSFHPSAWVPHDFSQTGFLWRLGHFRITWSPKCVWVTSARFGEVTD